ncbi:MAG: CatB-related O-acetyltransferase [Oscillospiraceae bacterium]|nr:CatB-related O-acetyltransferase [Oscillospiraceae bacterium]
MNIKFFDFPFLGKHFIMPKVIRKEGGQQQSKSLRSYYQARYKVSVDMYSYGCFDPDFNYAVGGEIHVGRYCSFAKDVHYFAANHPMNYVAMSPYFYNPSFGLKVNDVERGTLSIGHGVWCGYGVLITSGCKSIGNGAVLAAGSIVTHDVPAYAVVGGNPARVIKYRFDDDTIKEIEESKWWEHNPDEIMEFYGLIDKPIEFSKKIVSCKH